MSTTSAVSEASIAEPKGRRLGVVLSLLVCLGAFVAGQVPMAIATFDTEHPDPPVINDPIELWRVETWGRYDTWLYLDVARGGPKLEHCQPPYWKATDWCGNVGWLPLFPAGVKVVTTLTPLREEAAGALIARAAYFGELVLLWFAVFRRRLSAATVLALLLASVAAGTVWLVAIFPMSLTVLLVTGSLVALSRSRWFLAGALAGLASTAHTMGVIGVGVGGLCLLLGLVGLDGGPRVPWRTVLDRVLSFVAPAAACYVAMLAWYRWQVGYWNAPFMVQAHYHHHLQNPVSVIADRVQMIWGEREGWPRWQYVQTSLVALSTVLFVGWLIPIWNRVRPIERYLAVAGLAFWIIPLSYGGELASYYRLEALTMPAVALSWRLPRPVQGVLLALFAYTSYKVAKGFYIGVFI